MRAALILSLLMVFPAHAQSRAQLAQEVVDASISGYQAHYGNCPCPFNRAKNNSKCGKRSAWSKPGGQEPVCYVEEVTDVMIERYLEGR